MRKFALVEFEDGESISLISSSWLVGTDECYWPKDDVRKLAKTHAPVKDDWMLCSCRILGYADTYDQILSKEKQAIEDSDCNTGKEDAPVGRGKRPTKRRLEVENDSRSDDGCPKAKKHDLPRVPDVYKNKSAAESKSVTEEVEKSPSSNQTNANHAAVTETIEIIPATAGESSSQKEKQSASDKRVQDNSRPIIAMSSPPPNKRSERSESNRPAVSSALPGTSGLSSTSAPPSKQRSAEKVVDTNDFQSTVLHYLVRLRNDNRELKQELLETKALVLKLQQSDADDYELDLPEGINFPIETLDDVNTLETALGDKELTKQLIVRLALIGGTTLPDTIGNILKYIFTVRLQRKYSWYGKKQKESFCQLKIARILCKSVRKSKQFADVTDDQIRLICAKFFTNARDRKLQPSTSLNGSEFRFSESESEMS